MYDPDFDMEDTVPPIVGIKNISLFFDNVNWKNIHLAKKYKQGEDIDSNLDTSKCFVEANEFGKINFDSVSKWNNLPINLHLPYNKNHLTFSFIGISWMNPNKVKYKFHLEGLEEKWNCATSKTEATYSNLEKWNYKFLIKAMNKDGYWSEPTEYSFIIHPPWWETRIFKTFAIITIAFILYGIYQWRISVLKHNQRKFEKKVKERTAEVVKQNHEISEQRDEIEAQRNMVVDQKDQIEQIIK